MQVFFEVTGNMFAFILLDDINEIEPYYAHLLLHLTDELRQAGYTLEMRHDLRFL